MGQIIIVEDSNLLRLRVCDLLQQNGYKNIKEYESATHIIQDPDKYLENTSLIITDIELPETSGMDLTKELKNSTKFSSIPIMIMSCHGNIETVKEAITLGVADYIIKPFKDHLLLEKVKHIVGEAREESDIDVAVKTIEAEDERNHIKAIIEDEHSRAIKGEYSFGLIRLLTTKEKPSDLKSTVENLFRKIDKVHITNNEIIATLIATDDNGLGIVTNRIKKQLEDINICIQNSICIGPNSDRKVEDILELLYR